MLFNSFSFVVFFAIVYSAYLLSRKNCQLQNRLLLLASYVFYGSWDWRFLSLLFVSTAFDFYIGKLLANQKNPHKRKVLLSLSVTANLSFLGFFKYFDFFADSFARLLSTFGMEADWPTLNIILPVGISFYTFHSLSYTIDIYRGKLDPTKSFLDFALFVAYFPQLVAGPIVRASHLLPQISQPRKITSPEIHAGLFLILWGYFKKVVIADNVGLISNQVFGDYGQYQGIDIVIGTLAFAVQIYCDFSGYTDIARGLCKLMGFNLLLNFRLPYLAESPSDFWQRWHISLSSWLRDYLYIPLGGNRHGELATYRNLMITMLLGGLWHGAAWTFVIWGAYHGLLLCVYRAASNCRHGFTVPASSSIRALRISIMFGFTLLGWLIFRSETPQQILDMVVSVTAITAEFSRVLCIYACLFHPALDCDAGMAANVR